MRRYYTGLILLALAVMAGLLIPQPRAWGAVLAKNTPLPTTPGPSPMPKGATATPAPTDTATLAPTATETGTPEPSATASDTPLPAASYTPWPGAPACAAPDLTVFHTLWNSALGCHYDHEHGDNPFTPEVAAVFPGIQDFLCGVQIGSCNPSSPAENTAKHGGHKWHVQLTLPEPCVPFDAATVGASAAVIEYHSFGDEGIELEARTHSAVVFVRQCNQADPTDTGLVYAGTLQDYGQRIVPYQGAVVGYPNQPDPAYLSQSGPYLATDCVGPVIQCRSSGSFLLGHNAPVSSIWTSKWTGIIGSHPHLGTSVFQLLFRLRDGYRLFDWNDQEWPFTFQWVCSPGNDGSSYVAAGCRYNNATTQVQEIQGTVPAAWDGLAGFDTDPRPGRVTGDGYTDASGALTGPCLPGGGCYPLHLVNAFVGQWGAVLVYTVNKDLNVVPFEPSRNIYFCGGVVCAETDAGSVASGWIGPSN